VVGRLVEQQVVRAREQDAGEFDAASLTTGEGADRLVQHAVWQAEVGRDPGGLRVRGVATGCGQFLLGARVGGHRLLLLVADGFRHRHGVGVQPAKDLVEPTSREDAVLGQLGDVTGARVLGQVADLPGPGHQARCGE